MVKYFVTFVFLVIIVSCSSPGGTQTPNATYENLQGIWGVVNDYGYFEFFDFINDIVVHGQIDLGGYVSFINIGAYHFHGPVAHSIWVYSLNSEGDIVPIEKDIHFAAFIEEDRSSMIINFMNDEEIFRMDYLGINPDVIDEILGVPILGEYTADYLIERLLRHFVLEN